MTFLNTFRGRLLLILALLLVATLGVQYYLNLRTQNENTELREKQEQAIAAGFALGLTGMTAETERLQDFIAVPGQRFLDENARERIRDIIIVDNEWKIIDSLDPELLPVSEDNGEVTYKILRNVTSLPPLVEDSRLSEDLKNFPNRKTAANKNANDEAHAIPIETSKGRWYVMVLIRNQKSESTWRAARPLVFTLGTLIVSSLITFLLVWRFARPIANLSNAARAVAEGNLTIRVPDAHGYDEMGRLAGNFNEMVAELEKKRDIEAQLQQAEKSAVVGRLGSAIAHEIRNPLNYINLTLDHLRAKFTPDDTDKRATFEKLTSQLKAEVARINQQISDFLNYSRPAKADLQPTNARDVVEASLRIIEPEAIEKHVTISVVEHENVPEIMGDAEFLRSVFNNLFINALQAMEKTGGRLNIRITPNENGECVNFEISDTGNGILPENLSKIFEPYFSTKETGTGLGLAIVHKIVDIHHGKIEVESIEGEGTKFTVKLPKADI